MSSISGGGGGGGGGAYCYDHKILVHIQGHVIMLIIVEYVNLEKNQACRKFDFYFLLNVLASLA